MSWTLRDVPEELAERYKAEGWWTDETLGSVVAERLAIKRDLEFVIHSKVRPWRGTIGDVDLMARSFAGWLREHGVGPGDVVLVQLPNWVEAAAAFWGAAYAGATVVPFVHFYGVKELTYVLGVVEPKVVVTPDVFGRNDYLSAYTELLGDVGVPWLVVGSTPDLPPGASSFASTLTSKPVERPVPVAADATAIIAFTSGTTSNPKGVLHTHRTAVFEAKQLSDLNPDDGPSALTGAPVGHFMGMQAALVAALFTDKPTNLIDVWDPAEVLRLILAEGISPAGGSPYFLLSLLEHPDCTPEHISRIKYMGLGGAAVPPAFSERATALGIKIYRSYGSTEQPSITGSHMSVAPDKRLWTDGCVLLGVEIRLDEDGQILSRGPDLCLGYTDPELTARTFDAQGWYRTGDVGVIDDEGFLTITDRVSDFIIRGGENISAAEVEDLLLGLEAISEVGVVAESDPRFGEHAAAVLTLRPGAAMPSLAQITAHLEGAGLARQKWPEAVYQVADFPRTPSGKVQKFVLRQSLRDGKLQTLNSETR